MLIQILIRSVIIVLAWYFIVGPLFSWILKKWLVKKQSTSRKEILEVTRLLPSLKAALSESWKLSSSEKGIKRVILCCKVILVHALYASRE